MQHQEKERAEEYGTSDSCSHCNHRDQQAHREHEPIFDHIDPVDMKVLKHTLINYFPPWSRQ